MAREGKMTTLTDGFVGRVVSGLRYAVLGDTSWFGPGAPPEAVAPPETQGRAWDYPTHYNLHSRPRQHEATSFEDLRNLADGYDLLRLVIETRKDQLAKLSYSVGFRQKPGQTLRQPPDERCAELEEFLRRPDRRHGWATWLRMVLEDLFVIDAPAIYVRRNMAGGIYGLEPVDGASIKVVLSEDGRIPHPPEPAYQQYLKGLPAVDYTTEELVYFPRNPRAHKAYGFSPVEQIMMTVNIAIRRQIHQLQLYCYSEDTEVLTKRGWLRFSEVNEDDEFATRRIGEGLFEWQKAYDFFEADYEGEMIHFNGKSVDLLVTPDHRMLVNSLPKALRGQQEASVGGEHVISAEQMMRHGTRNTGIPQTSVWVGEEVREQVFIGDHGNSASVRMSGDDFCAFMGMYLAEGNVIHTGNKPGRIAIAQTPGKREGAYEAYEELLRRIFGDAVCYSGHQFEICRKALADYLRQFGKSYEKFIPEEILNATPRQMEIFWKYYYLGDGGHVTGNKTQWVYTVSKRLCDNLFELLQKMGYAPRMSVREAGPSDVSGRAVEGREGYVILRSTRKATKGWTAEVVPYRGKVACVCVPNKFLYVRRNGIASWSGNTEGNIPEALAGVPDDWTPEQISQFQAYWDSILEGDTAQRRHMKFIPGQLSLQFTKDPQLKDEFDEWLARVVCYAFSVPPLPFVREQNRATANTAKEAALDEGLAPLMNWVKDLIDHVIQDLFGYHDLEFMWTDEESMDPATRSQVDISEVRMGLKSIDEVRVENGDDPVGMKHAIFGVGPLGVMFIEDINTPEKREAMMQKMQGGPEGMVGDPLSGVSPEVLSAMGIDDPVLVEALSQPHPRPTPVDPNDPAVQEAISEDGEITAEDLAALLEGAGEMPVGMESGGMEPGDSAPSPGLQAFAERYLRSPSPPPPAPIAGDPVVDQALHVAGQPGGSVGGDPVEDAIGNPPAMPPHADVSGDQVVQDSLRGALQQRQQQEPPMDPVVREALRRQSPVKTEEDPAVQFRLGINSV